jgi:hypothetical protein
MGIGISCVKLNLDLWRQGLFKDVHHVIEMGSQELHLKLSDFEDLVQMAGVKDYKREDFTDLDYWPGSPRLSSRHFYDLLGIKKYSCVDLNKTYGAISLDLNYPLEDTSHYGKYDLVTDFGTNEHAFNVAEAYRTMHRLCMPGGLLINAQMVYKGNGYYTFDAPFFEGLAAANDYSILYSSYIITSTVPTPSGSANQFHIPLSSELLDVLDWSKTESISVCYVFRKNSKVDFNLPYQEFVPVEQKHYGYQLQYLQAPPSRSYIPMHVPGISTYPGKDLLVEVFRRLVKKSKKILKLKKG